MLLSIWKQHQSKVSTMQLNRAQGNIYLTITFAVLIFMIKAIRHLWVACAGALRLTTIVKWGAIQGFTWMSVSSVCDAAQSLMEMSLPGEFLRLWHKVSSLKPQLWQRIIETRHIALCFFPSFLSLTCLLSLSLKKSYLWCQSLCSTHQRLHSNWTALYSPWCLAVRQSILQVANYSKERKEEAHMPKFERFDFKKRCSDNSEWTKP